MCSGVSGPLLLPVIFVVDDDDAVRASIEALMQHAGYQTRGFNSGVSFLEAVGPGATGCVLMDLRMPDKDGLCTAAELRRRGLHMPIAFLSAEADIPSSVRAIKLGASDFILKPVSAERLLGVVGNLVAEHAQVTATAERERQMRDLIAALTGREREVLDGLLLGLQNKQIARKLGISHRTVEIHRANVMRKAHASNLMELLLLLDPGVRLAGFRGIPGLTHADTMAGSTPAAVGR